MTTGAIADGAELAIYEGRCDASAAVAISADKFLVANDEDNEIGVYAYGSPKAVAKTESLNSFLQISDEKEEADIEGAAGIGDLVYWISSHGRNRDGEGRPDRRRLFATHVSVDDSGEVTIKTEGEPYKQLVQDLAEADHLQRYGFANASDSPAGTTSGLNIEGLASTPEGHLLIGFRGPLFEERALVVPVLNPNDVISGSRAELGEAIELDLGGRGIRSLEADANGGYLIVAGAAEDRSEFRLYRWSGNTDDVPRYLHNVDIFSYHPDHDLSPEALFQDREDPSRIHMLSDDGKRAIESSDPKIESCGDLKKKDEEFRVFTVTLDE